ncbi:MAG TPA: MBL fold metallo-hydrolase [Microvirga sp.]|jgi:ribonuclease Z|nr:MBL fold metallo-hydrolase [Microvirga sp.]
MSWLVQPRLINGPFDDPGLYVDFRYGRRAILFDLGDLGGMAARELTRVSHALISHTHMDHMAGFDRLLRLNLHRDGPLTLVGPPGFIDQVEHRIRGFTWNLIGPDSVDFRLAVQEFDGTRIAGAAEFRAREVFARQAVDPPSLPAGVVLAEEGFRMEAAALDHGIPSLAFCLRETLQVNVLRGALDALDLPVGPWLNAAKAAVRRGEPDDTLVAVPHRQPVSLGALRARAFRIGPGQAVAYVTDCAFTAANRERILALARGADQLFIEAVFLEQDAAVAAATRHLTAAQAGRLAREAGARHLNLFHHSARYIDTPDLLHAEALAAFAGGEASGAVPAQGDPVTGA